MFVVRCAAGRREGKSPDLARNGWATAEAESGGACGEVYQKDAVRRCMGSQGLSATKAERGKQTPMCNARAISGGGGGMVQEGQPARRTFAVSLLALAPLLPHATHLQDRPRNFHDNASVQWTRNARRVFIGNVTRI